MTIEERKALIDKKVRATEERAEKRARDIDERKKAALNTISDLAPRINDLISLANYARDKGISLTGYQKFGGHEGYDTDLFITNGWSHLVGFVNTNPIIELGITAGGACGNIDFRTNGVKTYGITEESHTIVEPRIEHLEEFVRMFDTFETEFYAYIDKVCTEG